MNPLDTSGPLRFRSHRLDPRQRARLSWPWLALGLAFGLSACGGGDGGADSGSGGTMDSGGAMDSGGGAVDCTFDPVSTQLMGADCLPRCTAETASAVAACGADSFCANAAITRDAMASIEVSVRGEPTTVDCFVCVGLQTSSCLADFCGAELATYDSCAATAANPFLDCTAEDAALTACQGTNSAAIMACEGPRAASCMP